MISAVAVPALRGRDLTEIQISLGAEKAVPQPRGTLVAASEGW